MTSPTLKLVLDLPLTPCTNSSNHDDCYPVLHIARINCVLNHTSATPPESLPPGCRYWHSRPQPSSTAHYKTSPPFHLLKFGTTQLDHSLQSQPHRANSPILDRIFANGTRTPSYPYRGQPNRRPPKQMTSFFSEATVVVIGPRSLLPPCMQRSGRTVHEPQEWPDETREVSDANRFFTDLLNMEIVRRTLGREAGYLRSLESANTKLSVEMGQLRERHESIEVVGEGKRGLDVTLSTMGELREKYVGLEVELGTSRAERAIWVVSPSTLPFNPMQALMEL